MGPVLNEVGNMLREDTEKTGLLNAFFALGFAAKNAPWESQTLEIKKRLWGMEEFLLVEEDLVRNHLGNINAHKS